MNLNDFGIKVLCFISLLSNCTVKINGSSLTCCFEILSNHSVSYHLSEPPGANCTRTWSEDEYVVVDEHGNVDEAKVVYAEPQKLILKGITNEKVKEVTYRKDCLLHTYTATCHDLCVALDPPRTTPAIEATGGDHSSMYIIAAVIIIITIIIIFAVICLRRKCQSSKASFRCIVWKGVPKNESPTV
ncbi:hypothetical protein QQF64_010256 [Cirrhinus molitorella]|uniref:Uncharacterized protein n=2 Tax=Cirrhinus molitorella TaxID=172907 RepID=A0AA88Q7I2_9TELE|nr:hypothetical protein Q8A67_007593 [Cirrhinus molitorella]